MLLPPLVESNVGSGGAVAERHRTIKKREAAMAAPQESGAAAACLSSSFWFAEAVLQFEML